MFGTCIGTCIGSCNRLVVVVVVVAVAVAVAVEVFPKMVFMFTHTLPRWTDRPWWFHVFFNVHPYIVGEDSHFDSYVLFPDGWFNH